MPLRTLAEYTIHLYNFNMNQSSRLYQLQKIDLELDMNNNRLVEIQRLIESDDGLIDPRKQVNIVNAQLQQGRQHLRSIEESVNKIHIKISTSEASLYAGKIRNPKELQDLQNEVASLKKHRAILEDQQIEAMLAIEQLEENLINANALLGKMEAESISQKASLSGEKTQILKNNQKLLYERKATLDSISDDNLAIYETLRKQKRGIAVAPIDENGCTICGYALRPAERQAAHSPDQMAYCSSCGRILYSG